MVLVSVKNSAVNINPPILCDARAADAEKRASTPLTSYIYVLRAALEPKRFARANFGKQIQLITAQQANLRLKCR